MPIYYVPQSSGPVNVTGTIAATQAADTAAVAATVTDRAQIAATQAADTASVGATVTNRASIAATQAADVAAIGATVLTPVSGSFAVTQAPDGAALVVALPSTGVGGYGPSRRRYYAQVGGKLVAFASASAAASALDAEAVDVEPQNRHERRELAAATRKASESIGEPVQPVEVVPLEQVLQAAASEQARQQMQQFLRAQEYQALMRVYAEWQDEQEIEELLLLAA